jgi:hypothetical protein
VTILRDDTHGTPSTAYGWTICVDHGSDRPVYEADLLTCRHCGLVIFMCDGETKAPLPASAVASRCPCCDKGICRRCKVKMNSGEMCEYFIDKIHKQEDAAARRLALGL